MGGLSLKERKELLAKNKKIRWVSCRFLSERSLLLLPRNLFREQKAAVEPVSEEPSEEAETPNEAPLAVDSTYVLPRSAADSTYVKPSAADSTFVKSALPTPKTSGSCAIENADSYQVKNVYVV